MTASEALIYAIFRQTVADYAFLKKNNLEFNITKTGGCARFSVADIESFLNSEWSTQLLATAGCALTGSDILDMIHKYDITEVKPYDIFR